MEQKPSNTAMLGDNFQFSLGPPDSGFSLFLADRTKKIHFIRHAEGHHNVMTATSGNNDCLTVNHAGECPADHELWDARLTDVGVAQAKSLRDHLATRPSGGRSFTAFDLVVVSPLTRTCETALHVFGRARKPGCPAFLDAGLTPQGSPEARQGFVTAAPRILVREECRERWGKFVCDGRRPISDIIKEFPDFDFSEVGRRPNPPGACALHPSLLELLRPTGAPPPGTRSACLALQLTTVCPSQVEHDEDIYYSGNERESDEHCCERSVAFLQWLNARPEKCIAVVTHSSFLRHLFCQFGGNLAGEDNAALQRMAGNCLLP
jgi:broad specificity phosphatase PhoE|tara:strand:+ start:80 stop:1042 length:963 start_codon:yes stop_codon:yes gene_type:complete